jgi:hypothetical protein
LGPEWFAVGISTDQPTRFQGFHGRGGLLFVGDEASGIDEAIYEASVGFLTKPDSYVLLVGNPNHPGGYFYQSHRQPGWAKFKISALEVPPEIMDPAWPTECERLWGADSPAYQVRVLGEFPLQGDDTLIGMADATAAQTREIPESDPPEGDTPEIVIGADIARFGGDESVCYVRQGDRVIGWDFWRGHDTQESAGRIAALIRQYGASVAFVDEIGVGGGVVDALKHLNLPVVGVNVGSRASDPAQYLNRRAELFFHLRDRFRTGRIAIPPGDGELLAQLTSLRYKFTPQGKTQLESKDDMRRRGLHSPDRADALALAFSPGVVHAAAPILALPADWFARPSADESTFLPWD